MAQEKSKAHRITFRYEEINQEHMRGRQHSLSRNEWMILLSRNAWMILFSSQNVWIILLVKKCMNDSSHQEMYEWVFLSTKIRNRHRTPASFFFFFFFLGKAWCFHLETQVFFRQSTTTDHQKVACYLCIACYSETSTQRPNYSNCSGKVSTFLPASDKSISSWMDSSFCMH